MEALTAFEEQLRLALKHIHNSLWLGEHSPLAAPYFLMPLLAQPAALSTASQRGAALQTALHAAVLGLWGSPPPKDEADAMTALNTHDEARYHFLILDFNYFHAYAPAQLLARHGHDIPQSVIYNDVLHISRASHDRHLQAAVRRLAAQVLSRSHPALGEGTVTPPQTLVGRDLVLSQCLHALHANQTVNVVGATGVGKTALGASVCQRWQGGAVLWFTLRPHINTDLPSLLMTLARFLQRQGAASLLGQLVADGGQVRNPQLALSLLLNDLARLPKNQKPLLCLDDADVLLQATAEANSEPVRAFLDALRGHVPLLLLGQRAVISADVDCALKNLSEPESQTLLHKLGLTVDEAGSARAYEATAGNPRLLWLIASARLPDENILEVAARLPRLPSLPLMMARAFSRLPDDHRNLLYSVAIFNRPAPLDVFGPRQEILTQLATQGWLELREPSAVGLSNIMRELILGQLMLKQREALHGFAAQVYAARGDATSAADHFVQAGQYEAALLAWLPNAEREVQRGNAASALAVLSRIPAARLSKTFAEQLALARARLHRARGSAAEIIEALSQPDVAAPSDTTLVDWLRQIGWAHEQKGNLESALAAYTRSQQSLDKLLAASVNLATSRAQLAIRKRDMDGALKEAQRARYEAERTQGIVYDELGEPDQAREHFVNALAAAEALGDASAIAFTCNSLGIVAGRQADGPASRQWLMRAMQGFEDVGNLLQAEIVRSNIAALCITTRDFSGAVAAGESALAFFQAIKHSRLIASTASSVAEAFFELNQLDKATRYAELVLAQEESQFTPYALFTLGEIKHAQSQTAEARAMLEEAMRIAQSNQDQYIEAYVRRKLGQVLLSQGEDIKGQKYLKQARELFQKMGMTQELT